MPLTEYSQQLIRAECNENHFAQIGTDGDAYRAKQGRWVSKEGGYYLSKEQGNSRGGRTSRYLAKEHQPYLLVGWGFPVPLDHLAKEGRCV